MAQTRKEQALKIIAKQIKELDNNAILLDELKKTDIPISLDLTDARSIMFNVIRANGYELEANTYKLIKK